MPWKPPDPYSYAYLLGVYLGDGCIIVKPRGGAQLVVSCDAAYPGLIEACWVAIQLTIPYCHVGRYSPRGQRCVRLMAASKHWPMIFPQHGPGRKHKRRIVLEPWQRAIVDRFPREFLRGLLHSDGCRTINRFKVALPSGRIGEYEYPRYFFSNLSADIRGLFCEYCDRLGIRWSQSNHRNISISHRDSVAVLDSFVGPKT